MGTNTGGDSNISKGACTRGSQECEICFGQNWGRLMCIDCINEGADQCDHEIGCKTWVCKSCIKGLMPYRFCCKCMNLKDKNLMTGTGDCIECFMEATGKSLEL